MQSGQQRGTEEVTAWHARAALTLGLLALAATSALTWAASQIALLRTQDMTLRLPVKILIIGGITALIAVSLVAFWWAFPRLWREVIARDPAMRRLVLFAWPVIIVVLALRPVLFAMGSMLSGQKPLPLRADTHLMFTPLIGTGAFVTMLCLGVVLARVVQQYQAGKGKVGQD